MAVSTGEQKFLRRSLSCALKISCISNVFKIIDFPSDTVWGTPKNNLKHVPFWPDHNPMWIAERYYISFENRLIHI